MRSGRARMAFAHPATQPGLPPNRAAPATRSAGVLVLQSRHRCSRGSLTAITSAAGHADYLSGQPVASRYFFPHLHFRTTTALPRSCQGKLTGAAHRDAETRPGCPGQVPSRPPASTSLLLHCEETESGMSSCASWPRTSNADPASSCIDTDSTG